MRKYWLRCSVKTIAVGIGEQVKLDTIVLITAPLFLTILNVLSELKLSI